MMKKFGVLAIMVFGAACSWGQQSVVNLDIHAIYQVNEAEKQLRAKKYKQAQEAFADVAASTSDQAMAAVAQARAAVALGLQENKYEEGLERARAVDDRACSVQGQMQLMMVNEDFQKLVDTFGEEDIGAWPRRTLPRRPKVGRRDVRAVALFDRGRAFLRTGDGSAAARDIDHAFDFADTRHYKRNILSFLARNVYARALEDEDKAFETNMRIVELDAGYAATMSATISAARYLRNKERYDEALAVLAHSNWRKMTSRYWFTRGMKAITATLAAAEKYDEAADAYRLMAEADDKRIDNANRNWAALQLGKMLAAAGDVEAARGVYKDLIAREEISDKHRKQAETALAELISSESSLDENKKSAP